MRITGRTRTADLHLSEVTVLFTTGLRCASAATTGQPALLAPSREFQTTNRPICIRDPGTGDAETQFAISPRKSVALWPLSYGCMEHPAGFEPATSRLTDEVTAIFTTDHAIGWRGTGNAEMILEQAPRSTGIEPARALFSLVGHAHEVSASSPPPCLGV